MARWHAVRLVGLLLLFQIVIAIGSPSRSQSMQALEELIGAELEVFRGSLEPYAKMTPKQRAASYDNLVGVRVKRVRLGGHALARRIITGDVIVGAGSAKGEQLLSASRLATVVEDAKKRKSMVLVLRKARWRPRSAAGRYEVKIESLSFYNCIVCPGGTFETAGSGGLVAISNDDELDRYWDELNPTAARRRLEQQRYTERHLGGKLEVNTQGFGVIVLAVEPGGPLAIAGVRAGDVLVGANKGAFTSFDAWSGAIKRQLASTTVIDLILNSGVAPDKVSLSAAQSVVKRAVLDDPDKRGTASAANRLVPYGQPGFVAYRLQMFAQGNFKELEHALKVDSSDILTQTGPVGLVLRQALPNAEERLRSARYAGLIGQYAMVKSAVLGSCGAPTRTFETNITFVTEYRNMLGVIRSSTRDSWKESMAIQADLYDILLRSRLTSMDKQLWVPIAQFLMSENCSSGKLKAMEANMRKFHFNS